MKSRIYLFQGMHGPMNMLNHKIIVLLGLLSAANLFAGEAVVQIDGDDPIERYAAARIKSAFAEHPAWPDMQVQFGSDAGISAEGYRLEWMPEGDAPAVKIIGGDARGLLYGSLNLLEQMQFNPDKVESTEESARFPFRALKFNLPWVSYRDGTAIRLHAETCRDLKFWESFLDMMADNRFNALTLWSLHPFHLMIRNEQFPEACDLTDAELADWQAFLHGLFAMAKERGIETYIVNWNIFVSPAFAKHHGVADYCDETISSSYIGPGDRSQVIKDYMRTTVTQLIDTYPDLTGLGISYGERMEDFTPVERQQWFEETFAAGMKKASRPIRFINRLPFSKGSAGSGVPGVTTEQLTRNAIESMNLPTTVITEAKFNWSHAHSSPKLIKIHGGKMGNTYWNPPPKNYQINWMIRNEDFFALRWCEPDFVRSHIAMNGQEYVGGYYLGSECYIPAKNYISAPGFPPGYAFERQWLYYMVWGRLLYNPELNDDVFINACTQRYGPEGKALFDALKLGSRMPLRLASFYDVGWDYTLYSEGFMANSAISNPERLITVEELIKRAPLEPDYLSIKDFVRLQKSGKPVPEDKTSPLQLADQAVLDGKKALEILDATPREKRSKLLADEEADARAWAHLNICFGEKLKAAVALQRFRQEKDAAQGSATVGHLDNAVVQWELLSAATEPFIAEMPLAQIHNYKNVGEDSRVFHWKLLLPAARAELRRVKDEVSGMTEMK